MSAENSFLQISAVFCVWLWGFFHLALTHLGLVKCTHMSSHSSSAELGQVIKLQEQDHMIETQ